MNPTVIPVLTMDEFVAALRHPSALAELGVVAGCLALAWMLVRLLRSQFDDGDEHPSIWFGRRLLDGALFPLLTLTLALLARRMVIKAGLPLALFKIVVPVLVSFAVIRLSVRVLTVAFPSSRLVRAAERTISWLAWLAVVGWITGVLPELLDELDQIKWTVGASTVSVRKMIDGTLSAGLMLVLVLWISAAIESKLLKGAVGEQLSLRKVAANMVRAVLTFVGLLLALSAVGIDLTALSVLGGAVGVGIGLGLQKLAANYVSGFVILAERSVRIGDTVRIGGFEGRISDITTRYTVVRSIAGSEAIIPNETLMTSTVENLSLADPRVLLTTTVSVAYGTDVAALRPKITATLLQVPRVLSDPVPSAHLAAFGPDGLDMTVVFWISDPENGNLGVRSAVNLALLALFEAEGVEIPYPQRVVHWAVPHTPPAPPA
jgi:small-conductance mechanosensitive channel